MRKTFGFIRGLFFCWPAVVALWIPASASAAAIKCDARIEAICDFQPHSPPDAGTSLINQDVVVGVKPGPLKEFRIVTFNGVTFKYTNKTDEIIEDIDLTDVKIRYNKCVDGKCEVRTFNFATFIPDFTKSDSFTKISLTHQNGNIHLSGGRINKGDSFSISSVIELFPLSEADLAFLPEIGTEFKANILFTYDASAIPEPSSVLLLGGSIAFMIYFVLWEQRRSYMSFRHLFYYLREVFASSNERVARP